MFCCTRFSSSLLARAHTHAHTTHRSLARSWCIGFSVCPQLISLERLLTRVGPSVIDSIVTSSRAAALLASSRLEQEHRPLAHDYAKKRQLHQQSLKPSLRNPSCQAELRALQHAEGSRSESAFSSGEARRRRLLAIEEEQAQSLLRQMTHQSVRVCTHRMVGLRQGLRVRSVA